MAKNRKEKPVEEEEGEQLDLIDVAPENIKKIISVAKRYRTAQTRRIEALGQEVTEKQNLLTLIKQANLKQVDGKIRFRADGLIITVTPRDELVKIKDETDEDNQE